MRAVHFVPSSRLSDGLDHFLHKALREEKHARRSLKEKNVHDFRVALRRSRSLAEGFGEMDPRPAWRHLRKACRKQLHGLSEMRDAQMLAGWVRKLELDRRPEGAKLVAALKKERKEAARSARVSLKSFPRKRWKRWSKELPDTAGALSVGKSRLARIAFDRLEELCARERRWRHSRSGTAWHRVRLGVKRLRYTIENFLPEQQATWGKDLKRLQTVLGEGHDLDVLRGRILTWTRHGDANRESQTRWLATIDAAREKRTAQYLRMAVAGTQHRIHSKIESTEYANANKRGAHLIYEGWREELKQLAKVSPVDAAKRVKSAANSGSLGEARSRRYPGKLRQPS